MLVEYPDRSVNPVVYAMASQYLLRPGDRVVPLLLPVNIFVKLVPRGANW